MPRLSINEMTTYRWSFDEDVQHYTAAGIAAIGVWRQKLSDFGEQRGIELLKDSGLAVSNLSWAGGFTGSEGHTYQESLNDAAEAIRLSAALASKCLVIYSGARAGHTHNHARRLLIDALKQLAPLAEEHGVTLALEPMHPACSSECTFLTSWADAVAVVDALARPCVQLSFDTYYMFDQPHLLDQLHDEARRIAIVHLADGHVPDEEQHRTRLGKGGIPIKEMYCALSEGGYDGDYDVELFGDDVSPDDYQSLLRETKDYFAEVCR